jgi:hypothetical protein
VVVTSLTSYISSVENYDKYSLSYKNMVMVRSLAGNSALPHEVDTRFDISIKFALMRDASSGHRSVNNEVGCSACAGHTFGKILQLVLRRQI